MPFFRSGQDDRWNHNIHYQRLVLREIPDDARRALDVGCGEGLLARALRQGVPEVVGIDRDAASIALARTAGSDVEYVHDNVLSHPFAPGSFDLVASIAVLHHMDTAAGLKRMADLLAPGGRLVVVGHARSRLPRDLGWELAGAVLTRTIKLRRRYWEHSAPIAEPRETYAEVRAVAERVLPGVRYRRLALWRYLLVWTK